MTGSSSNAGMIVLPSISIADVMQQPAITSIIDASMSQGTRQGESLKLFLEEGLQKIFSDQNRTVEQINTIFAQVVDIQATKQEIKQVLIEYEKFNNDAVTGAIVKIDDDLTQIKPMLATMRNSLEGTIGFFKSFFGGGNKKIFSSTIQGISGRVDSISAVFENYGVALAKNEEILGHLLPTMGLRIKKIDAMTAALGAIVLQTTDDNTKKILQDLIAELTNISGLQKESMARLMMLSMMNGNAKLVLQATEVETITTLQPLIIENIVGGAQKKAYELRDKARAGLQHMREASKANISSIMDGEAQNKEQQVQRLQEITSNIDRVLEKSKNHVATMTKANDVLQQYMPTYKAKIAALESGIVEIGQQSLSFVDASREIITEMTDEKVALVEKYEK